MYVPPTSPKGEKRGLPLQEDNKLFYYDEKVFENGRQALVFLFLTRRDVTKKSLSKQAK